MKPAPFDYLAPRTVDEALEALARHGEEAKVLAGGQSLVPMLNFRLARPAVIVDINRVSGLDGLGEGGGTLQVGALVRQRRLERWAATAAPLLHAGVRLIGHPAIRTRGTVGGSIAHADPAAEYPAVLVALEGEVVARGPRGERVIGAADFFQTYLTTALAPDEILTEVRLPAMEPGSGWAFEEFARRHGDFAIVGIAALVVLDGRRCRRARLAAAGAGPVPVRLRQAEAVLERGSVDESSIQAAAAAAERAVEPDGDLHASAEYRRHLTGVLTARALRRAVARAEGRP